MSQLTSRQGVAGGRSLPDGWRWARLRDVCEIIAGQSPPSSTYRDEPEGLPFFQGKADFGLLHPVARVWCVEPSKTALPGNILISVRAPVGPTNVADVECCIGRGLAAIRCAGEADRDFVLHALRMFEAQLVAKGAGSTFEAISRNDLEKLEIPLPPLTEQKRIAALLNEQMAAVTRARQAIGETYQTTAPLFSAYLRSVFSPENLRRWPKRKFGEIAQITASQVDPTLPQYRDLPHVNGENIQSGTCRLTYLHTAAEERMVSGKYLFEADSVLYSKLRPYLRKAVHVDFRGLCSADMYPIKVDRETLDPRFVAWMLLSEGFTDYAINHSQRARMPKLNRNQLFSWEAPVPPLEEQELLMDRLEDQMSQVQGLVETVEQQRELIEHLPATLLRGAFNGEV